MGRLDGDAWQGAVSAAVGAFDAVWAFVDVTTDSVARHDGPSLGLMMAGAVLVVLPLVVVVRLLILKPLHGCSVDPSGNCGDRAAVDEFGPPDAKGRCLVRVTPGRLCHVVAPVCVPQDSATHDDDKEAFVSSNSVVAPPRPLGSRASFWRGSPPPFQPDSSLACSEEDANNVLLHVDVLPQDGGGSCSEDDEEAFHDAESGVATSRSGAACVYCPGVASRGACRALGSGDEEDEEDEEEQNEVLFKSNGGKQAFLGDAGVGGRPTQMAFDEEGSRHGWLEASATRPHVVVFADNRRGVDGNGASVGGNARLLSCSSVTPLRSALKGSRPTLQMDAKKVTWAPSLVVPPPLPRTPGFSYPRAPSQQPPAWALTTAASRRRTSSATAPALAAPVVEEQWRERQQVAEPRRLTPPPSHAPA
eukprot:TRINITY_DN69758_c0_g1_i1.p1 TRINITY_DN69758_c0_g1~~TRINITY_DN69758_c0_g1_i1.p1  ORF type:complete len:419 (-),score=84.67 TRINITY_DN69758_c0_g1_i1:21-1277(-)